MAKNLTTWTRPFFALALVAFALACNSAHAQTTLTGEWTASVVQERDKSDKSERSDEKPWKDDKSWKEEKRNGLNLNMERRTERGGHSNMGQTFDFSELQGLTREQALAGGPVRFSLVREAGTVEFEGSFQNGRGSGTFRFNGNPAFVAAMKSRGFDFEQSPRWSDDGRGDRDDRQFAAAVLGVTTALADDLLSADFGKLDVDDLFKAAIFKVDSKFMREMKASGFPGLRMEELVKARIFKIDAEFVRQATQMGFDKESFESLIKMRIFKVTPEFIAEVKNEGLNNLSVEDLVKMRIFKIDAEFIRRAKADGVPLEVEELVQQRIGVRRRKDQ
jgi:hypothetical protein